MMMICDDAADDSDDTVDDSNCDNCDVGDCGGDADGIMMIVIVILAYLLIGSVHVIRMDPTHSIAYSRMIITYFQ